jgi:uncharacterized protein (DUF58 family)
MWLGLVLILFIALLLLGGLAAGGVYAIVLIPIAAIVLVGALILSMWRRATQPREPTPRQHLSPDLPHSPGQNVHAAPSTPDQITDARQGAQ